MTPRSNNKPNGEITRVAVVTGSSSGIGFETALLLARSGFHTYATMRNLEKSKRITKIANTEKLPLQVVQLDVNDDISVKNAIDKIVGAAAEENKRIDALVNNAGYGLVGALEDLSLEEIKAQFETNLFGVIRVTQQVLPVMRKQNSGGGGGGTIVNVSSVGGRMGIPILSAYQSTKFALEGLSESISYELEPFGIRVVIIEPGFIRTNIVNSSTSAQKALDPKSPYFPLMQKVKNHFKSMIENASSSPPEDVAKVILQAITSKNPQLRYTVGNDAATIIQARMNMPDKEFRKMVIQNF
ncbi:MAG TPA: SDR family oxidoreductase, partial [Nitrososphaeraceae archaeon]|nr:SDR family oxidoreductase [Nitrososphaeraceae archaeon]